VPSGANLLVNSVEEKLSFLMSRNGVGTPIVKNRSVVSLMNAISTCQNFCLITIFSFKKFVIIIIIILLLLLL
jgi:hypothetical protein